MNKSKKVVFPRDFHPSVKTQNSEKMKRAADDSLPVPKRRRFDLDECTCYFLPGERDELLARMKVLTEKYVDVGKELAFIQKCVQVRWDQLLSAETGDAFRFCDLTNTMEKMKEEKEELISNFCPNCQIFQ